MHGLEVTFEDGLRPANKHAEFTVETIANAEAREWSHWIDRRVDEWREEGTLSFPDVLDASIEFLDV